MTDFVLVHGGGHGAWCWADLIAELEHLGHRAHALDLPGHGNDPTPRASVTFDAYVAAVEHFIADLHLDDCTLVGHSIAGMILPDVVSRCDARISEVVFLAALVLDAGERAIDLIPESRRPSYYEMAQRSPERCLAVSYDY